MTKKFELFFKRIKKAANVSTDTELCKFLNINKSTLSMWKKRERVDHDLLFKLFEHINFHWLITGEGEMLKNVVQTSHNETETIAERLIYYKIKNSLTYFDLGTVLGINPDDMRMEIKLNKIKEEHINIISEKFGISKEWLFTGKGEMSMNANRENINNLVAEPRTNYEKGDNNKITILEKENEFLKENIISLRENIKSIKETNDLLKYKIKGLEVENKSLKNKLIHSKL